MPFLTQGNTNWNFILIVVVFAIIVGGGIWIYIQMTEEEFEASRTDVPEKVAEKQVMEVSLSPDFKSIILQKDTEEFEVFSIEQWQQWAAENWDNFFPEPLIIAGTETQPEDFYGFTNVSLFPDEERIIFVAVMYRALTEASAIGILDLNTDEIFMININPAGRVEEIIWSPTGEYIAYALGTARDRGDALAVDDVVVKKNSFLLRHGQIASALEDSFPYAFTPQFRDIEWSSDGKKLYFKTNNIGSQPGIAKGEVEWTVNADGTGLQLISVKEKETEIPEEETASIFKVSLPVKILKATIFSEKDRSDNSIGVLLEDNNGKEFSFCLDKRKLYDHYFFFGVDHPSKQVAQKILYGSQEEKQLLKILESWDHSDWQPADQFDNTKAVILMFIRALRGDALRPAIISVGEVSRVYQNKEFNFEFKFPENWFIFDDQFSYGTTRNIITELWRPEGFHMKGMDLAGGSPQKSMSVTVEKLSDHNISSAKEFVELITGKDSYCMNVSDEEKIQISGRDAYVVINSCGHTYYYYLAIFEKDNYLYQIDFEFRSGETEMAVGLTEARRAIFSTFRFLQ